MNFKYLSLNIWLGGLIWDNLIAFLQEENADIMSFQEVYNGHDTSLEKQLRSFDELKTLFPDHQAVFTPAYIDTKNNQQVEIGNAVFSRFPIIHYSPIFFDIPFGESSTLVEHAEFSPRNMCKAEIQINEHMLYVYSLHGVWGTDGEDNERRLNMSDIIIHEVQDKQFAILSGDTNLKPHTQSAKQIDRVIPSIFGETLKTTFNLRHKTSGGFHDAAVDMLFVSKKIHVKEASCPDKDVSDHLPLIAMVELPN